MSDKQIQELYDRYCNTVYRIALGYTHSVPDAEDITQEVFLKLMEKRPKFLPGKERAWLIRVTVNACKDLHKSAWKQNCGLLSDKNDPVTQCLSHEESVLFCALGKLPHKYRIVVHLHYYEGYTFKEIASILRTSTSTISMRMHRSREILKQLIKEDLL